MLRRLFILLSIGFSLANSQVEVPAFSVPPAQSFVILLSRSDTAYTLPHTLISRGSEIVVLDSARTLRLHKDYEMQYFRGIVSVRRAFLEMVLADSLRHSIRVTYDVLPFSLKQEYYIRKISVLTDTAGRTTRKVESSLTRFSVDDIFGTGLQKSGSIFRGLTVGSTRDLTLNSGFRMQLSGKLSSDLDIAAALTDENVPIQPEGTTQTLQELDKVFIQLKSPRFGATLGDFIYQVNEQEGGEFGKLSRKLQGATGNAMLSDILGRGSTLSLSLTGATARGKFTTNQFQGIEGNQGPYRLTGEDPSRQSVIIAGTERVYIDGQQMTRGEINDYTIDYSTGEVFFSARRLITNASRITIDFEYTDRQFTRNLVGVSAGLTALDNRLQIHTSLTQEADDPSSPIDIALNDSLRGIIGASGNDRLKATASGVTFAGRDSVTFSGKGQYILRDTLINGRGRSFLVYAPGDPQAYYSATFSFLDQMPADSLGYNRANTGGYVLAGLGKGSYLPIQFLPIPELHRVLNGNASFAPGSDISVSADYALSSYDRNRLSSADESTSQGGAYKLSAEYHPRNISIGGFHLGEMTLSLYDRFVDRRFVSLDRANEVEFNRNWNIADSLSGDEEIRQALLSLQPAKSLRLGAGYGSLERKGSVRTTRTTLNASLADSAAPKVEYGSEFIQSENLKVPDQSSWIRQRGTISYNIGKLEPGVRIETENRQEHLPSADSLFQGSYRYLEIAPSLSLLDLSPVRATAEVQVRAEDSAAAGAMSRAFRSLTQLYDFQLHEWRSLSSSLSLALRRTDLSDAFAARGATGSNTMLIRSQVKYSPLQRALDSDLLYEFARERSTTMKRVFIRVPKGAGNYVYLGDLNHNGIADENEFEQSRFDGEYVVVYVPGDVLVPVVDLKVGIRARINLGRLFPQRTSTLSRVLSAFSSETVARVEEKSTEPDARQIYLLHLSKFQNDSTTISGSNLFTQDLYLFEADPTFSVRFRYTQRHGLVRLVGSTEKTYSDERGVRIRSQLLKEIGNQTEYTNKVDRLFASVESSRQRDLLSNALRTEFSYRPYPEWEVAFGTGISQVSNRFTGNNAIANLNDQFLRLTYSILSTGQLRSEIQREEVSITNQTKTSSPEYPYELTNGEVVGKTMLWNLAFDYRISQYVQVTVTYDGRSEGGRPAVHTARAEARAFF